MVFLDIQMDGMNGIETAGELGERQEDAVLIFITGIKEYVFDARDLYAFHYLLKPLDEKKFAEVLEKAAWEAKKKKEKKCIFLKTRNLMLDQSHILHVESRAKKQEIHTAGADKSIEIYASMDELEGGAAGFQEINYMLAAVAAIMLAISANIIERMASDPATAAKYEKYIADAPKAAEEIKEGLAAHGAEMVSGKSGTVEGLDVKI